MKENWDFYFIVIDGRPCSTMLDLGLAAEAPRSDRPWLVSVRLPLLRPRPDGLADDAEADELGRLEDSLVRVLRARLEAQFVGRMTWNGTRDLFFYAARHEGLDEAMLEALGVAPGRRALAQVRQDRPWQHYREVLFPGPLERRWIADRRLVDELAQAGDRLERPRPVDHFASFQREDAAQAFASACAALRFDVEVRANETQGWTVRASREDPVELGHIHEVVTSLFVLAEEHRGVYDRWGCALWRQLDA